MNKLIILLSLIFSIQLFSQEKINVLILQNEYAHDVDAKTLVFEKVLNNTGNYSIDKFFVRENDDWNKFEYNFDDYELIITSRLGSDMPEKLRTEFVDYIANGGNLVITHQGVSSFYDWPKFHEPIAWTVNYGKGRVFVTVLGHVMKEEYTDAIKGINSSENKKRAIYSVGFQTLFARGAEWAATGKVTTKIPDDFPSKTESSSVEPSKVKWND